ncbi:YciI family protein [Rhizobium sp. L1K21]|uniref:YciI family protein n=1 Tax=Rhizobium sp. L1K21 TaxID=2954933 RepID=UPI0020920830|nr:YciI family protein [Rhizobium sp. L1K21]MCO6185045.1 YciI family protein [Rhizobium sp. L1K21]
MFIVSLTYKVGIEVVEAHLDAHVAWLKDGYEKGICVASGRKVPRTGGVILVRGDREMVEAFSKSDPFVIEGVADCELTEVDFSMAADGFEALKG